MNGKPQFSYSKIELLHRFSLILLIVFVCTAVFCGCVSADSWTDFAGTAYTPQNITYDEANETFTINSSYGLAWAANDINTKPDNNTKTFILNQSIDLAGHDWTAIGAAVHPFSGNFYGNDSSGTVHTISNFSISDTGESAGLFGYVLNANITNVTIDKIDIYYGDDFEPGTYTGGLIGYCEVNDVNTHYIKNCSVTGVVRDYENDYSDDCDIGGLIGKNIVESGSIKIEDCSANVEVGGSDEDNDNNVYAGGFIGYCEVEGSGSITIENCCATGDVTGDNYVYEKHSGGFIGLNGVDGSGSITIENCYASGNLVEGYYTNFIGGFIARNEVVDGSGSIKIENCSASGNIEVGDGYYCQISIGGFIGCNGNGGSGSIKITNGHATGNVIGYWCVGGFIGDIQDLNSGNITIENCYATGNVSSIGYNVGGLIGQNQVSGSGSSYVNNSTALNKYVNCSDTNSVGRIVGYYDDGSTISLNNNYAWEGMKNGDDFFTKDNFNNGTSVSNKSVWCNESFFRDILGWDFTYTWAIESADDGNCYPLPYLQSLGENNLLREKVIHLRPHYTVTFDSNTGTGTMKDMTSISGESIKLTPNAFIKTGHTFEGWSKTPNGAKYYEDNQLIPNSKDITLYAVWEKIPETTPTPIPTSSGTSSSYYYTTTYIGGINYDVALGDNLTVFFNSTGGSHVDNQTNLHYGDKVTEPDDPIKDGYIFDAWYTVNAYKWDFKNDTVNKSFTLYAKWNSVEVPTTPTQSPMPILGLLMGLCVTVLLFRRK